MRVLIGIATYKRQRGLERLLDHLCRVSADMEVTILVLDNDSAMSALPITNRYRTVCDGVNVIYDVEPRKGTVHVRNRILGVAKSGNYDFLAFIDDDEWPAEGWLKNLIEVAKRYDCDVVGGPVIPVFRTEPPGWLRGFYERRRWRTGMISGPRVSTNNVLVRVSCIKRLGIEFDPEFNLTGGADTMFFVKLWRHGIRFGWANDAVVYEEVPPARLALSWVLRRAMRTAGTAYRIRARVDGIPGRVYALIGGFIRLVVGLVSVGTGFWSRSLLALGLWNMAKATGTFLAAVGWVYREYASGTTPLSEK